MMDNDADKTEEVKAPVRKKKKGSLKEKLFWLFIIIGCFFFLRSAMMFLLIALLPTIVVKITDYTDEELWFKTIGCFNLAAAYPYLMDIVMVHNGSIRAVQAEMTNANTWLIIYGSAAAGYAAMWICPTITEFFLRITQAKKIERHRRKANMLHKEWNVGEYISKSEN